MLHRRFTRFLAHFLLTVFITILAFPGLTPPFAIAQLGQSSPPASPAQTNLNSTEAITGIPANAVTLDGEVLFQIEQSFVSVTATERAQTISEKIAQVANNPQIPIESIQAVTAEGASIIGAKWDGKNTIAIITNTEADAKANNQSLVDLTNTRLQIIRAKVKDFRQARSFENILKGIGATAVTTVFFFLALRLTNWLFTITLERLRIWMQGYGQQLKASGSRFLSLSPFVSLIFRFAELGRNILYFLLICLYVFLVLGFFPLTQNLSRNFWSVIWNALAVIQQAVIAYMPKLVLLALIFFITRELLAFIRLFFREVELGNISIAWFYTDWVEPTFQLVRFLILAIAVTISMPFVPGFQSPAFQGISLLISALFTLGAASAVANIVGGVVAVYTRAFLLGDIIRIGDIAGTVIEKNLLVTRIRTTKNVVITIPNSTVTSSSIVNYSAIARTQNDTTGLILHTTITLGYDVPWRQVNEALIQAAIATSEILATPAPFVLQTALNDYHVSYELNAYTDNFTKIPNTYSTLHQNIQDKCNEAGIEILSPSYLAMRDGNHTTIPANYLPDSYDSPGFQIEQFKSK